MTLDYARDLWMRAQNALKSAEVLIEVSADDAASRAYYAAFDAVSAGFAVQGTTFKKHKEVRSAVHRDLVKEGHWTSEQGAAFDSLWELRDVGDYGGGAHVEEEDARSAVAAARSILHSVIEKHPELAQQADANT